MLIIFWNQLDYSYQLWVYNGNIDTYQFILENYLNHYSTTNNTNNLQFANWGIDFFIQNPNTTKEQFQYIIYNKTSYETNLGDDDNNTIGGYDNTTYNTFNPQQQPWTTIRNVFNQSTIYRLGLSWSKKKLYGLLQSSDWDKKVIKFLTILLRDKQSKCIQRKME